MSLSLAYSREQSESRHFYLTFTACLILRKQLYVEQEKFARKEKDDVMGDTQDWSNVDQATSVSHVPLLLLHADVVLASRLSERLWC